MTTNSHTKSSNLKDSTKRKDSLAYPAVQLTSNVNLLTVVNKTDFHKLLKETKNRLIVIEFFADWCGPCKILARKLEQLALAYNGKILIVKVDVEKFEELAVEYDVAAMPTFMLMKNQQKLEQFSSSSEETLNKNLEKYAGKPEISGVVTEPKIEEPAKGKIKQTKLGSK